MKLVKKLLPVFVTFVMVISTMFFSPSIAKAETGS